MVGEEDKLRRRLTVLDGLSVEDMRTLNLEDQARKTYEEAISQELSVELQEYHYSPYDTNYTRAIASREWANASIMAMHYQRALGLAKKAEEKGISLSEKYSVFTLSVQYKGLEKNTEEGLGTFMEADHRLCIENYDAWKRANK